MAAILQRFESDFGERRYINPIIIIIIIIIIINTCGHIDGDGANEKRMIAVV